jgi:hypothetical protein
LSGRRAAACLQPLLEFQECSKVEEFLPLEERAWSRRSSESARLRALQESAQMMPVKVWIVRSMLLG